MTMDWPVVGRSPVKQPDSGFYAVSEPIRIKSPAESVVCGLGY